MKEPPYVLSMAECGTRVFVTIIDPEEKTQYNQPFSHTESVVMQRNAVFKISNINSSQFPKDLIKKKEKKLETTEYH
jgi:hypothetical protein